jgi:hypothetical protein
VKSPLWLAANGIHPSDQRPTGAAQLQTASALWQQHLNRSLGRVSENSDHHHIQKPPSAEALGDRRTKNDSA